MLLKSLGVLSDHRKFRIIARFKVIITEMAKPLRVWLIQPSYLAAQIPWQGQHSSNCETQRGQHDLKYAFLIKKYSDIWLPLPFILLPMKIYNNNNKNIQRGSKLMLQEKRKKENHQATLPSTF